MTKEERYGNKRCPICEVLLAGRFSHYRPRTYFSTCAGTPAAKRHSAKKRYWERREHMLERAKKYYKGHKEEQKEYSRQYWKLKASKRAKVL